MEPGLCISDAKRSVLVIEWPRRSLSVSKLSVLLMKTLGLALTKITPEMRGSGVESVITFLSYCSSDIPGMGFLLPFLDILKIAGWDRTVFGDSAESEEIGRPLYNDIWRPGLSPDLKVGPSSDVLPIRGNGYHDEALLSAKTIPKESGEWKK